MESLLNDRKQSRVGQMLQKVCQMQPVQKSSQLRVGQVRVSYMQSSQKNWPYSVEALAITNT